MRKVIFALSLATLTLTSCGTKKKIAALEAQNKECQDLLNSTTVKLNLCLSEKEALSKQNEYLKQNNSDLINNQKELTMLTSKGAQKVLSKGYSGFSLDADSQEDRQQFGV